MPTGTRGKTMRKTTKGTKTSKAMTVTKKVAPAKLKDATKVAMMNVVNRILNRKTETKYASDFDGAYGYIGSILAGPNEWRSALPGIVQGTNENQRIGDSIKPVSNQVKLSFRLTPADLPAPDQRYDDAKDVYVVIWYGFVKKYKKITDVLTNSGPLCTELLDQGNGTVTGFTGRFEDMTLPVNARAFNLKRKVIRLSKQNGPANQSQGSFGALTGSGGLPIVAKHVTLKFKHKSQIHYTDAGDQYANDYAPVYTVAFVYSDGAVAPNAGGVSPVQMFSRNQLWFTDM